MSAGEVAFEILKPSNAILLIVLAALLALPLRRRLGARLLVLGALAFAVAGGTPLGPLLVRELETRVPAGELRAAPDGIILLGGYIRPERQGAQNPIELNEHADRLTAAAALANRYPKVALIVTDGTPDPTLASGASVSGALLTRLGIAEERLVLEGRARSTYDNAWATRELVGPGEGERYALVTSAFHMPRSLAVFRAEGWPELVPVPVDRQTGADLSFAPWRSAAENLRLLDLAAREHLATLYYYALGRIDHWRPGAAR